MATEHGVASVEWTRFGQTCRPSGTRVPANARDFRRRSRVPCSTGLWRVRPPLAASSATSSREAAPPPPAHIFSRGGASLLTHRPFPRRWHARASFALGRRSSSTGAAQRLRRIRQLGVTSFAFPGAEHSRFAHALGAAFVMKLLLRRLRALHGSLPDAQRVTLPLGREALAAAFLHDLGHGPLSHLFEEAIPGAPPHETWTERIVLDGSTGVHRALSSTDSSLPARVADLVRG